MASPAMIHARVDAETKSQAQAVLNELGMTLSEAISLYLRQIVFRKGIPFDVKIPNELTMRTIGVIPGTHPYLVIPGTHPYFCVSLLRRENGVHP